MAKDPAILWYFDNWAGGTVTLSRHLKGCYMDLLNAQFNNGHLSIDEIKTVLGSDFSAWNTLQKKFDQDKNGLFFSNRMEAEIEKRKNFSKKEKDFSDKQRDRVNGRYQKYTAVVPKEGNGNSNGVGILNENGEIMEFTIMEQFEIFWDLYDKKTGKINSEKLWVKISKEDRIKILEYVPSYVISTPDKEFRKNPETFLFNQSWNDEIIIKSEDKPREKQNFSNVHVP